MIAAASYIPIVFGLFYLVIYEGKRQQIVYAGIALALQLLVGYQTMAMYTLDAVGIMLVFALVRFRSLKPIGRTLAAGIIALGLSAVQLLPESEFIRNSIRTFDLPYSWTARTSMPVDVLRLFLRPFFYGNQRTYAGPWPNLAEYFGYIGVVPFALAVVAILWVIEKRHKGRATRLILVAIAVFGVWMSLGSNAPLDLLRLFWQTVPLYHATRIPSRHLILTVFGLSALAAVGLQRLRNRALQIIVAAVILFELVPFARSFMELNDVPERRHDPELVALLSPPPRCKDVSTSGVKLGDEGTCTLSRILPNFGVWLPPRDSLDFDSAMSYRFFSTTGYDPSILRNYYEFIDAVNGSVEPSILEHDVQVPYLDVFSRYTDFLNVRYVFVPPWADPLGGVTTERFSLIREDTDRQYRLYENNNVLPRFFLVPHITILPDRNAVAQAIREGREDPSTTVLVSEQDLPQDTYPLNCSDTDERSLRVISYSPNAISLNIDTPCNAILASSEVMYPGWEAWIDGKKSLLFEGNLAFRTLYVPEGSHTIVIRYNPRIFALGGMVSLLTLVACIIVLRFNPSSR